MKKARAGRADLARWFPLAAVLAAGVAALSGSRPTPGIASSPEGKVSPAGRPDVRKALGDPDPQVRLKAALALAEQPDEAVIGVLIDLLAELPAPQRRLAEQ